MTTLVETRRALELLSMGNQQERRTTKRPTAPAEYEQDDDFQFVRRSKRVKTEEPEPPKKAGRGRPPKGRPAKEVNVIADIPEEEPAPPPPAAPKASTRKTTRRKASEELLPEEPEPKVPRRGTRRSARQQSEDSTVEEPAPARTNGASHRGGRKPKSSRAVKTAPIEEEREEVPRAQEETVESAQISLPMSDTPIINRNKEMRKKGGNSNRRSSLGSRGRRASSLIESGQTAIPHQEVKPDQFYKHIEEGLVEPRRMKQLLTWCGERALAVKPRHGTKNSSIIHGARAIQDQLLKDFASRSEFSDWFSRDEGPKVPVILKANPRNIELDEKMEQLEAKVARLQEEKKIWQAMRKPPPANATPLYTEEEATQVILPDFDLLDDNDGKIRGFLADQSNSSTLLRSKTEKRLQSIRSSLEFEVDQLADNVHKLEQRVAVASQEADKVLSLSANRLREREEKEKRDAGTKEMPIMEVLRSLGSILPEGGG